MTLWVTLLLVWTVGIPAALFLTALVAVKLNERRARRLPSFAILESVRIAPVRRCGGRVHNYRSPARRYAAVRPRVGLRRRA